MADIQHPLLLPLPESNHRHTITAWISLITNIFLLLLGQAAAILLSKYYYTNGGNSKWIEALLQNAAFPILFIPYFFLRRNLPRLSRPSIPTLALVYIVIGTLVACDTMFYSSGISYLSASTYSLVVTSQLAFMAIFSYFINHQKITALILNSIFILLLSAVLLALNNEGSVNNIVVGVSKKGYILGVLFALGDAAMYPFAMSLMQLAFQKLLKEETYHIVLEMQIWVSAVASCVNVVGLYVSGEWQQVLDEVHAFRAGKVCYILTLVGTAVAWRVFYVCSTGLIFTVSSLFANSVHILSLAFVPFASFVIFHDVINGVKTVAMLLAFWGCALYIYQNYLDEKNPDADDSNEDRS